LKNLIKTVLAGLILGLIFHYAKMPFVLIIFSQILIFGLAALGLNIVAGYAGQLSIGHCAFMLIGAYTTSLMSIHFHTPFILNVLCAILIAGAFGLLIGLPALRLKEFYLAIATMAFVFAIEQIATGTHAFGGHLGIKEIPRLFKAELSVYLFNFACFVAIAYGVNVLINSPIGIRYKMVRDSEVAAKAYGIRVASVKLNAFVVSAVICGFAGALYAHTIGYVYPVDFGLFPSVNLLAYILIGGVATLEGGLIGAAIFIGVPFFFSRLNIPMNLLIGICLIIFVLFFPQGIAYGLRNLYSKYFQRPYIWLIRLIMRSSKPGKTVTVNGKNIHYVERGEGQPVIMIHGNFACCKWYYKVWDMPGYKTYSIDLPNYGWSDWTDSASIDGYADAVLGFMDELKIDKAIFVGNSLGGVVSQTVAVKQPDRVEKMLLLASGPPNGYGSLEERYPIFERLKYDRASIEKYMATVTPAMNNSLLLGKLANWAYLQNPMTFIENLKELEKFDLTKTPCAYKNPLLFLLGKRDIVITSEMAERTLEYFGQNDQLKSLESIGHGLTVEDPELF
jgi:branched-chain amino acid transport system permease protein